MKKYSFKDINCVYVLGSSQEDFKYFFSDIKNGLNIKEEDFEKPHPKEAERIARQRAREEVAITTRTLRGHNGIRFNPPPQWDTATLSASFKPHKKSKGCAKFAKSIFIISGDSGLGLNTHKNQNEVFENFNKILNYNNSFVFFIRGNHDDPDFFDGEKINYSNIKAIPDYSVIETACGNVLCVGGAISIDREWRKRQEERINNVPSSFKKRLYCEKEAPFFDADAIEDVVNNIKIDYVVSHSAPSFATPENNGIIDDWVEKDKTLREDVEHERLIMDKIFNVLSEHNMKPKYWAYSHFSNMYIERRSNTIFRSISNNCGFNPLSIPFDMSMFLSNEEGNKKKLKTSKLISKLSHLDIEDRHQDPEGGNRLLEEELRREDELNGRQVEEEAEYNEEPDAPNNDNLFEEVAMMHNEEPHMAETINTINNGTNRDFNPAINTAYERLRREFEEYRIRDREVGNRLYTPIDYENIYTTITTANGATTVAYDGNIGDAVAANGAAAVAANNDEGEGHG